MHHRLQICIFAHYVVVIVGFRNFGFNLDINFVVILKALTANLVLLLRFREILLLVQSSSINSFLLPSYNLGPPFALAAQFSCTSYLIVRINIQIEHLLVLSVYKN